MKKVIYLIVLFLSMLFTLKTQAQTSFTTSPNGGQCYSPSSNYGYAGFNNTITAQSFSWAVAGPGGCNASYTTSSSGGPPYISIYYPCCGIYTITCYAFTGSAVATYTQTYQIFCANSISVSGTSTLCTSGTAYLNATSSTNYTNYFWQPGGLIGDSISVNLSSTTCFTVTGVTANGCTNSTVKCVTVQPGGVGINGGNSAICSGSYAILTATGATSYTWLPSGTVGSSLIVTPGSTTCYTVQGYNASCGGISTAVKCVTVIPSPTVSVSGNTAVCGGGSTTLTASGASTYTWMYGSSPLTGSVVVITPTASTCFSLLALNQNGCYGVSGVCLNPQGGLNLSVSGNTTICGGTSSTLTASGAQNYTWNPGGFTGSSIVVSPSVSACYTVTGTNSVGCSGSVAICVNVQSSSSVIIQGPSTLCAGSSATLFGSGGTSYTWNPGNIVNNGQLIITPSVNTCYSMTTNSYCGLVTVVRCVTVSTTNGSLTISGPSNLCSGYTATLNAFGANSFTWYPGGSTAPSIVVSPTAPICYTVIGTGCAGTLSASHCLSVTPNPVISVTGSTFVCPGSTGTLTASGATSYTWYGSNATYTGSTIVFTANATSCFSVMGTNGNGCYGYGGICVTPQSPLSVSGATSLCSGNSATLVASGSASGYTWMPGGMTGSVVVVSPTASICYTVTSTNTAGCNGYAVHCIQVNPKPIISVYPTATLCIWQPAGLVASGASSYTWLPSGATGSSIAITPTASSCYTVIGLNTWGCTNTAVNCFSAYPAATITISGSNVNCSGQSTTLTASGATNYYWMPGGLSGSVIVVSPTASVCYTVTGYPSGQMCPGTAVRCMSVLPAPIVSVSGNTSICAGSSANLSASGAQTYTWIPGNLTGSFITVSPTVSTCYTVVGTGASGCIGVNNICVNI
ncbi:MAG: hypothetical protein JNL60_12225, partial [Bacteroidia bacterium]|nr:hypothetical protein [Bacteroidia bacterium]